MHIVRRRATVWNRRPTQVTQLRNNNKFRNSFFTSMADSRILSVTKVASAPSLSDGPGAGEWGKAEVAKVNHYHPQSSDHHPKTVARALYDAENLYIQMHVEDRYVKCVTTEFQGPVWTDSCAEFFVSPFSCKAPGSGDNLDYKPYFNVETNCGGVQVMLYIEDCTKTDTGFKKSTPVSAQDHSAIEVFHSLKTPIEKEIEVPTPWTIAYKIPFSIFAKYTGQSSCPSKDDLWRAGFFKCGDNTSHPHWGSWQDIGEVLNFHQPSKFGWLKFN